MKLMYALVASVAMFVMVGCTDSNGATRVLKQNGYTDIQITGYEPFMCSHDDTSSTGFAATSSNGSRVSGSVCSAYGKGYTLRFK